MKKNTKEDSDKNLWDKIFRRKNTMTKEDAELISSVSKKLRKESGFRINL